jgi:hypothetical protein
MHSIGRGERDGARARTSSRFATREQSSAGAWPAKVPQIDVQGILPPEVVQDIVRMAVDCLSYLLGGGATPPLLPPMT